MYLLCNFLPHLTDSKLRGEIIEYTVKLWRDSDSSMRHSSIRLVETMYRLKVPEVLDSFSKFPSFIIIVFLYF